MKSQFTVYHNHIDMVRNFTRLRDQQSFELFGTRVKPAKLARAHAIVAQARSFIQASAVTIEVEPLNNSAKEEEVTSTLERWLYGVQHAVNEGVGSVYRDALWHYFESGQWILRTLFDVDLAIEGRFPFVVEAIDPRTFTFKKSSKGLICAAVEEEKPLEVVMHELNYYYNKAKNPQWEIPRTLSDKPRNARVKMIRYYDEENESLYIDQYPVWSKPHLMPRVPFDIAFCNDVPSNSEKPEELGFGLIYPVLDLLSNEAELMTKLITPVELFFYPSMGVRTNDAYEIRQAYPGQSWPMGNEAPSPSVITPNPNYQVIDELQSRMESDISRATFPEAVFGPMDIQLSGYAYTQAMSGLQERIKDYAREPERALGRHFEMLLWGAGHFNNDDVIQGLELEMDEAARYRRSFTVVQTVPAGNYKRARSRVELKESDILGHSIVRVSLQPNMDRDESSKYQRAVMAKTQLLLPDEFVLRDILKLERPDEVMQWKKLEELKLTNPEVAEFMADDALNQVLTRDTELAKRFEMWRAAKDMISSEQMMQGIDPATGQPLEQMAPSEEQSGMPPPGIDPMAAIDPAAMAQAQMMGQMGAPGMMPSGPQTGMVPPGAGMPGMPPMESMPMTPSSPEELMLQQLMKGGAPPSG